MNHTPWLERKFNFDYPASHFPFFAERLRQTLPRLESMLQKLDEKILEQKPGGKWSVKEHIGHLTDLEDLHERRIDDYLKNAEVLQAADMSNKKTNEAHHNTVPIKKLLLDFKQSRESFLSRLEKLDEEQLSRSALHPRLQKQMRLVDMVFFVAEHDNHHLVLINKTLEAI